MVIHIIVGVKTSQTNDTQIGKRFDFNALLINMSLSVM